MIAPIPSSETILTSPWAKYHPSGSFVTWGCGTRGIRGSAFCRDGQWIPQPDCEHDGVHFYYRPQTKLRKGNVFTPVCQSFCSQGGLLQCMLGYTTPLGRPPLGRHIPLGKHPHPKQTATAADGTHSTGMHSCSL